MYLELVCTEICPGGREARRGTCVPCGYGYYKTDVGVHQCNGCPGNRLTLGSGSLLVADCIYGMDMYIIFSSLYFHN